jgi:hypothetical protein
MQRASQARVYGCIKRLPLFCYFRFAAVDTAAPACPFRGETAYSGGRAAAGGATLRVADLSRSAVLALTTGWGRRLTPVLIRVE